MSDKRKLRETVVRNVQGKTDGLAVGGASHSTGVRKLTASSVTSSSPEFTTRHQVRMDCSYSVWTVAVNEGLTHC